MNRTSEMKRMSVLTMFAVIALGVSVSGCAVYDILPGSYQFVSARNK